MSMSTVLRLWHLSLYFLKIFLFFLLIFPLSEPVPVPASIDAFFLQLLIYFSILIFQKFLFLLFLVLLLD